MRYLVLNGYNDGLIEHKNYSRQEIISLVENKIKEIETSNFIPEYKEKQINELQKKLVQINNLELGEYIEYVPFIGDYIFTIK